MPGPRGLAPMSSAQSAPSNTLYGSMPSCTSRSSGYRLQRGGGEASVSAGVQSKHARSATPLPPSHAPVLQLHGHALQRLAGALGAEELQLDRLVAPKHLAGGQHEEKVVGDLASRARHRHLHRLLPVLGQLRCLLRGEQCGGASVLGGGAAGSVRRPQRGSWQRSARSSSARCQSHRTRSTRSCSPPPLPWRSRGWQRCGQAGGSVSADRGGCLPGGARRLSCSAGLTQPRRQGATPQPSCLECRPSRGGRSAAPRRGLRRSKGGGGSGAGLALVFAAPLAMRTGARDRTCGSPSTRHAPWAGCAPPGCAARPWRPALQTPAPREASQSAGGARAGRLPPKCQTLSPRSGDAATKGLREEATCCMAERWGQRRAPGRAQFPVGAGSPGRAPRAAGGPWWATFGCVHAPQTPITPSPRPGTHPGPRSSPLPPHSPCAHPAPLASSARRCPAAPPECLPDGGLLCIRCAAILSARRAPR